MTISDLRTEIRSLAAREDIDGLAKIPAEHLMRRREEAAERIEMRMDRAMSENRDLTERENSLSKADGGELSAIDAALIIAERSASEVERRSALHAEIEKLKRGSGSAPRGHSPLLVSEKHLRSHAEAIRGGSVFGAEELGELEVRANVASTDMGSAVPWGSPGIGEPVTLRAFAGIPNTPLTGSTASMASLTLPAGAAGVAEGTAHGEYDTIDPVSLSTLRYGRWTQVTSFVDAFDDLTAINRAHAVGIARDLNLADATAIITAAGTVTAYSASLLDQNVRAGILKVCATALCEPSDVVVFGSSAALAVVNGYAPVDGDGRGSVTTRIFGARVYVHEPTTAGNVYMFAPAGFRTFSDRLRSASTIDPTNGMNKFGQWLHSTPAGVGVVGAAAGVDVVSP